MKRTIVFLVAGWLLVAAGDPVPVPVWKGDTPPKADTGFVEVAVGEKVDATELTALLAKQADARRDEEHPAKPSLVPLLIKAPKTARWASVRAVMQCAADSKVRMWRVWFAMVDGEGKALNVPAFLPMDAGLQRTPGFSPPTLVLRLDVPRGAEKTRVLIDDEEVGRGYMGFAMAADRIAKRRKAAPGLRARIDGADDVPWNDVAKALAVLRQGGIGKVSFAPGEDVAGEMVVESSRALAKEMGCLPMVRRGKVRIWPAAKPEVRASVKPPSWSGPVVAMAAKEGGLVEILVDPKGGLRIGGEEVDLKKLTMKLLVRAEMSRDTEHPMQPSRTPVVICASKDVRWREIQWVMQAAADPDVRIWRIYLATRTEDGRFAYVPVFLPTDHHLRRTDEESPLVTLELKRRRDEKITRVKLLDQEIGAGQEGFLVLDQRLKQVAKMNPALPGEINAWAWTPYRDVVRAIQAFYAAGFETLQFVGAPPPGKGK